MCLSALLAVIIVGCAANSPTPVSPQNYSGTNIPNNNAVNPDARGNRRGTDGIIDRVSNSKRVALVIGNGAYQNESILKNPPNDAVDVAKRLSELGFQVILKINLTRTQMRAAIAEFGRRATNAEAALFFYAGHAIQNHNQNFLLPIDITTNSISDVVDQGITLSYPLRELNAAKSMVNIIIIDACRTPKFTEKFRSVARQRGEAEQPFGLARTTFARPDTMIVYATQPGNGALDSTGGRNSPFTTGFLAALNTQDLSLGGVLKTTSKKVKKLTNGFQVPYTDGLRTLDDFQFRVAANTETLPSPAMSSPANSTPVITSPSPTPVITSTLPPVSTAAADAEAARLAALEARRKQEEARIARLKQEQAAAKQAAAQAQAKAERLDRQERVRKAAQAKEAARLAALEEKRRAEEAKIARLQRQREAEERKAQAARAEAARLARLNAEREAAARRARAKRRSRKSFEPEMVSIRGGCFQMGSPTSEKDRDSDEGPLHRVCVKAFKMGKYEITTAEYAAFLNARRPSTADRKKWVETKAEDSTSNHLIERNGQFQAETGYERHPVNNVSWYGAVAYLQWLSQATGKNYRLPTEAEWEYAARGGTQTRYWWGDQDPVCQKGARNGAKFDDNAQCDAETDATKGTEAVGSYQANQYGLYDVHGNLWEWTCSGWSDPYNGSEKKCLLYGASARVLRGGSWLHNAVIVRAANRSRYEPGSRNYSVGFRACEVQVK